MAYEILARYYDELMAEVDYEAWFRRLEQLCHKYGQKLDHQTKILDLACGTGRMTLQFAKTGAKVVGVDLSSDMLTVADARLREAGYHVMLLQQDMRECILPFQVDLVLCLCDSLNYLTDIADVKQTFARVAEALVPGGLFIFDLNTEYKLSHIYGNNTYAERREGFSYIWENTWDPDSGVCQMDLAFYVQRPDGLFVEYLETHWETCFDTDVVVMALQETGMKLLALYGDDLVTERTAAELDEQTERITFVAAKL